MESRWEVRRLAPSTKLALANALKTVSYTHLDVYKRQPHARPSRRAAEATRKQTAMPMPVGMAMESRVHLALFVSLPMVRQVVEQGQCIREKSMVHTAVSPVSYTHLDVYKRQS